MRLFDSFTTAVSSIRRTGTRSLLTMLGIVIGVASVILVLSIGESAERYIVGQVASFGSDLLMVANGPKEDLRAGAPSPFVKETLTYQDYRKLKSQPWMLEIAAEILQSDTFIGRGESSAAQVLGTTSAELTLADLRVSEGRFLTTEDVDARSRVAVLGATLAQKSFGKENAIGALIKLGTQSFKVVGVMQPSGTKFFQNVDEQVYVPVTTAMDLYRRKYVFLLSMKTSIPLSDAKRRIETVLRDLHHVEDPKNDDFHVHTQEDVVRSASMIAGILQILLGSVAAISLVVGGIGIMNIMFVAVTERVAEIGLRKAVGARPRDIARQFLMEAVMLTTIGGLVGTLLGMALTWTAIFFISQAQEGWTFGISWKGMELGVAVSCAIGIVFGLAPAYRAAALHPTDALRRE